MSKIDLKINGRKLSTWQSLSIEKSMDALSGAFVLSTADFFPTGIINDPTIRMDDDIVILINDVPIITGLIEVIEKHFNPDNSWLEIRGRDYTGILIDSDWENSVMEWKNQTVGTLIINLCSPFGVKVKIDSSVSAAASTIVETFTADFGRKILDLISELCREHEIIPLNYGDGFLTLTKYNPGKRTSYDKLIVGSNVLSGSYISSNENRFKTYICKGTGVGSDNKQLIDFISPGASATDPVMTREKNLVILAETNTDNGQCANRVKWERNYKAGMSRAVVYELTQMDQTNKVPWQINSEVITKDDENGINKKMLISGINYTLSEGEEGESCNLLIVDPNTYTTNDVTIKGGYDK